MMPATAAPSTGAGRRSDLMVTCRAAGPKARGGIRRLCLHAIGIVPASCDCPGTGPPDTVKGDRQPAITGAGSRITLDEVAAVSERAFDASASPRTSSVAGPVAPARGGLRVDDLAGDAGAGRPRRG